MIVDRKNILKIDWTLVLIYISLAGFGIGNILSSSISGEEFKLFDLSTLYGRQLIFAIFSFIIAFIILYVDVKFFEKFSSIIYVFSILTLLSLFLIGKTVNGAQSWISFGDFNFQPSEFVKIAVALAISKYISDYETDLKKVNDQIKLFLIVLIPFSIIIFQNDTGTALVFLSLFLVLYREGISEKYISILFLIIILAVVTLKFSLIASTISSILIVGLYYILKKRRNKLVGFIVTCTICLSACFVTKLTYEKVLKNHQRNYIKVWLKLEDDPKKIKEMGKTILYNLNQSKKAISSGGIFGKGYLKGTRTMGNFVPAQHTDYIFSTIGEEWGFLGSTFIIILYNILIFRILILSESQKNKFSRVFGYSTAAILFIHFLINIGMVIGLTPTIGIPLPFLSYGGSSFVAFTILLFIFVRLDANKINEW